MAEIEFSIISDEVNAAELLQPFLQPFERENRARVRLTALDWDTVWDEIVKTAVHHTGPEISQVGSTWIGSLGGMDAINPLELNKLRELRVAETFFQPIWESGRLAGDESVIAIPWMSYVNLFYYRRDLFEKAGIDEQAAFSTPEAFAQALQRLTDAGVQAPWVAPTLYNQNSLHNIASWIWSCGGDFLSPDGKTIWFNRPEARQGIKAYFDLYRFMPHHTPGLELGDNLFLQGQAAVIMGGPETWSNEILNPTPEAQDVIRNTGIAMPFGVPFVGASHLVIWRHCKHPDLAFSLIKHLVSPDVQLKYAPLVGLLPVRLDLLSHEPFSTDPGYQVMGKALKMGRSFPAVSLWGLVENRLCTTLASLWEDVFATDQPDLDALITTHIDGVARRLQLALSQ